jgi:hypothetical protein
MLKRRLWEEERNVMTKTHSTYELNAGISEDPSGEIWNGHHRGITGKDKEEDETSPWFSSF